MENLRAHLYISGRVQGVCYRAAAEEQAQALQLTGWVRNTPEGKVEMVMEGEKEKIDEMIRWSHQGPPAARVTEVTIEWEPYKGNIPDFRITR